MPRATADPKPRYGTAPGAYILVARPSPPMSYRDSFCWMDKVQSRTGAVPHPDRAAEPSVSA